MSFQAMAWAIGHKLPTHDKFVLLMMANYASNERGDCFPSINRLVEDTGLSKDSVLRAIKALEARGLLAVTRRSQDGVNLPNVYQLHLNATTETVLRGVVADSDHYSPTAAGVVAGGDSNLSIEPIIKKKESANITFDDSTNSFVGLNGDQKGRWKSAYPATDVDAEILRAAVWVGANPKNKKQNYARFLTNWLSRKQRDIEQGANHASNRQSRFRSVHDDRADFVHRLTGRDPRSPTH